MRAEIRPYSVKGGVVADLVLVGDGVNFDNKIHIACRSYEDAQKLFKKLQDAFSDHTYETVTEPIKVL